MRPQEWNILENVPGDVFRLYRLGENARKVPQSQEERLADARYHIRGITYQHQKTVVRLFWQESMKKVRKKLHF